METNPGPEALIAALEKQLRESEDRALKYARDLENLKIQYADTLFSERQHSKKLQEEVLKAESDYERLRLQKGGFGLKAMSLSGFIGFFSALVLFILYLVLKPADSHTAAFASFRDSHLFQYERSISAGQYGEVEDGLRMNEQLPENKSIRPELEFARKLVGAARRRCEHK